MNLERERVVHASVADSHKYEVDQRNKGDYFRKKNHRKS